MVAMF